MPKYEVIIIEELSRIEEIEAEDSGEAYELISQQYRNSEIVLDDTDYQDTEIKVLGEVNDTQD